jgi:hypothetical protein
MLKEPTMMGGKCFILIGPNLMELRCCRIAYVGGSNILMEAPNYEALASSFARHLHYVRTQSTRWQQLKVTASSNVEAVDQPLIWIAISSTSQPTTLLGQVPLGI